MFDTCRSSESLSNDTECIINESDESLCKDDQHLGTEPKSKFLGHSKLKACHNNKTTIASHRLLVKNGCISHDAKLKTFTVLGSAGKPHVRIFPSEFVLAHQQQCAIIYLV